MPPPETESLTDTMALSMSVLPEVLPVTSIASSIGTPAVVSDASVRAQRAMPIFCTTVPILAGALTRIASQIGRPTLDFFHLRKATKAITSTMKTM